MFKKVKIAFVATVLLSVCSSSAFANLAGKWTCKEGGNYYVTQIGNEVVWYGEQSATSPKWSNVAHGKYADGKLTLRWADVPKGTNMLNGTLVIKVADDEKSMKTEGQTGGFGGTLWTR